MEFYYRRFIIYLRIIEDFPLPVGDTRKVFAISLDDETDFYILVDEWRGDMGQTRYMGRYFGEVSDVVNKFKNYIDFIIVYYLDDEVNFPYDQDVEDEI